MAGPNVSTTRTVTDTKEQHAIDHNLMARVVDMFDIDTAPGDGNIPVYDAASSLYKPAVNVSTLVMPASLGLPAFWRYTGGAYPTLPTTKPNGISYIEASGPTFPTSIPSWIGNGAGKVPLSYSLNANLA